MKAIAINGSPRKGWSTENLLKEALRGAEAAGAETKLVQLYDLQYTGCRSCFVCKRQGAERDRCALQDGLTPVLQEVLEADVLLMGSPIYFGDLTSQTIGFMERLIFPTLSYDAPTKRLFQGTIQAAFFYTMNAPEDYYKSQLESFLKNKAGLLQRLGGAVEVYAACDTYQFTDYDKYHAGMFDAVHKRTVRDQQFPKDLQAAYEIGYRLTHAVK